MIHLLTTNGPTGLSRRIYGSKGSRLEATLPPPLSSGIPRVFEAADKAPGRLEQLALQTNMADAEATREKEDMARLADLRSQRAKKAAGDKLKQIEKLALGFANKDLLACVAEAGKHEKQLGSDGVMALVLHGGMAKTPGMPCPEATAALKVFRPMLPTLKGMATGEAGQAKLLQAFASWLTAVPGRIASVGPAVPKMMVLMYDQDVVEEHVAQDWWAQYSAENEGAQKTMEDAKAAFAATSEEAADVASKSIEANEISKQAVIDGRALKRAAENSKCGGGATADEEAWEKECNQKHRVGIKFEEQAKQRAAALKKRDQEVTQEKIEATEAMETAVKSGASMSGLAASVQPFIGWLATAEECD